MTTGADFQNGMKQTLTAAFTKAKYMEYGLGQISAASGTGKIYYHGQTLIPIL